MPHYVAIVDDDGPERAIGIWFPDLPGCFSAGNDIDDALRNAEEAVALYADSFVRDGKPVPEARTLTELRQDKNVTADLRDYMVALVPYGLHKADAAE